MRTLAVLALPLAGSLAPHAQPLRRRSAVRSAPSMLVGAPAPSDAFAKVASDAGAAAELFSKAGPKVGELTSKTAVAGAALLAGALAPGGIVIGGAAALLGGGLTRVGIAPALVEGRYKAMQARVACLLRDAATSGDWTTVSSGDVQAIVQEFNLPEVYATALLQQIYAKYLVEVMRMPDVRTSEMNDLTSLRTILALSAESIGNAHYDVAVEIGTSLQWTSDDVLADEDSAEYRTVSKLLFLSDRAFATSDGKDTEEYGYEVGRVRAVFDLKRSVLDSRCSRVAAPFYERALAGTLEKLGSVDAAMLERARSKLGVDDEDADAMHALCLNEEIDSLLAGDELSDSDAERLDSLASVLGIKASDASEAIAAKTVPIYVDATRKAVDGAIAADEEAQKALGDQLEILRKKLRLEDATAEGVFKDAVKGVLQAPYTAASSALKLQNTPGALASLERLMDVRRGVDIVVANAKFLEASGGSEAFAETLAGGGKSLPLSLYKLVYTEKCENPDATEELASLAKALALNDADAEMVHQGVLDPKLNNRLATALSANDLTPLKEWIASVNCPANLVKDKYVRAYTDKLRQSEGIPSPERTEELARLQASLELDDADIYPALSDAYLPLYRKSALEAMGASGGGIVNDEYREGLAKLQARLGLKNEDVQRAFTEAAKQRLKPLVDDTISAFEEAVLTPAELAKKRGTSSGKDQGEDLNRDASGGGTFGIEAGGGMAQVGGSPEAVLSNFAGVLDFIDGNAVEINAGNLIPGDLKPDLFKQCVIADLQISDNEFITDAKKERYAAALKRLPGVLQLEDRDVANARSEVGVAIATKYCAAALQRKLTLDSEDQAFVADLGVRLGADLGDVSFSAKKRALLARLGLPPYEGAAGAERAASTRDAAVAMGIDLAADLGLPEKTVKALFAVEATKAIDEGDADSVGDVADGYGMSGEDASKELADLAEREVLKCIENAKASAIMKQPIRACEDMDRLLLYIDFTDFDEGKLEAAFANKKQELVDIYAAYCDARGPEVEAKAAALRELVF